MRIILSVISALICVISSAQLRSGAPVPSGGAEGLAPMSFGLTYACHPTGYAYVSRGQHPDIFVAIRSGMPEAKGLWLCTYQGMTLEGNPIYSQGTRVSTPWDKEKKLPSRIRVFQDGDNVLLLRLTKTKLVVCRYDGKGTFYLESEHQVTGINESVTSYDCIRRSRDKIEIVLLCNDGAQYRPETFKGDTQSYYDGAGIYRGALPRGGVMSFTVGNDWEQASGVVSVTSDLNTIVAPSEIAAVRTSDGKFNGYVISNSQGCLKFVEAGTGNVSYLVDKDRNVIQHRTYSSKLIAYPSVDGARADLLIGGEGAMYVYENQGGTFGEPNVVLEKNAPVYGGSLTVPNVCDWDGDGANDIVAGNSEGRLLFFKNNGTNKNPDFALPVCVEVDGVPMLLRPGYTIVQGPLEGAWGYLCPTVFDWNGDGLLDVVVSGSRAKYEVFLNVGSRTEPRLTQPFTLMCDGLELHGTWRVRPAIASIDGVPHIVIMDDTNALHLYRQCDLKNVEDLGRLTLTDGRQITGHNNAQESLGQWGRGKLRFCDWDGDGDLDIFIGSVKRSSYPSPDDGLPYNRFKQKKYGLQVMLLINEGTNQDMKFAYPVQLQLKGKDFYLGAHSNAPEPCLLGDTSNGPNLLVGCESGKYYFFEHEDITYIK